jgi:hypothetical protein
MTCDLVSLSEQLRLVDLKADIELGCALRKVKRERRSAASKKGWATRLRRATCPSSLRSPEPLRVSAHSGNGQAQGRPA